MSLEAQPWIADFRIAAALDSFPFFWVMGVGGFSCRCVFDAFSVLGSGFGVFLLVSSCPPPRSVPGLVWVIRPLYCGTKHAFEVFGLGLGWFLRFFDLPTPQLSPGPWSW